MKVIYMKPTLDMLAGQYPEHVDVLVRAGTVKTLDEVPYLVIEIPEEEPKKPRRTTKNNDQRSN
jgi:hypothetical protein